MNKIILLNNYFYLFRHAFPALSLNSVRFSYNKRELINKKRSTSKFKDKNNEPAKKLLHMKEKTQKHLVEIFSDSNYKEFANALDKNTEEMENLIVSLDKNYEKYVKNDLLPLDLTIMADIAHLYKMKANFIRRPIPKELMNEDGEDLHPQPPPHPEECIRRAPVVTIMGHVDHGKTTLLDALRKSRVVEEEFGGITQHIGAFSVKLPSTNSQVTFIDTPGHAAFKVMRQRGACATDIVVLVVAADDGIMEQTVESIKIARSAGASFVVAINKCDKENADPDKVARSLMEYNIIPESYGGDVQCVEISALTGKNLVALQEAIVAQAEIMDLKTTDKGTVEAVIIESSASQQGHSCTLIVLRGTLKSGSLLVAGECSVRARMFNEFGKQIKQAVPSTPVKVFGWNSHDKEHVVPHPGDRVYQLETESEARRVITYRRQKRILQATEKDLTEIEKKREEERRSYEKLRQEQYKKGKIYGSIFSASNDIAERTKANKENKVHKQEPEKPKLSIIVRTDVDGTLEAVLGIIDTYSSDQCELEVVDFGVGPPKETLIDLASTTDATVFAFNTPVSKQIYSVASDKNVQIEEFNVIYRFVEVLKKKLSEKLQPIVQRKVLGEGIVIKEFLIKEGEKKHPIAGVNIDSGVFKKDALYLITRNNNIIYEGPIETMKIEKNVVEEAKLNQEVGLSLADKSIRFKQGDNVEVIEEIYIPQTINWNPPGF